MKMFTGKYTVLKHMWNYFQNTRTESAADLQVTALPMLLHGSKSWTVKVKDWTRIHKAELEISMTHEGLQRNIWN
jgi:hypothetical protein